MKHTPGPWKVCCDEKYFPHVHIGKIKEECTEYGYLIINTTSKGAIMAEHNANAYLIAAAPELLDWIKAVVRQIQYERPNAEKTYTNGHSGLFGMEENLLNIIAKAEGNQK